MKRRMIATLLTLSMVTGLAVGCGSSQEAGKESGDGGGESGSSETITLNFTGWEASVLETQAVKDGIARFEEANPGIKINYTATPYDDHVAKLSSAAAGGALPDVMFVPAASYRELASKGTLLEITDKFDEDLPLDDFTQSAREVMEIDGKVYGMTACTVSPVIYYNKDIFDAAGVEYPSMDYENAWTPEELMETAKKLTGGDIYGLYNLDDANALNAAILGNGGSRFNDDRTKSTVNSPEVKEVFETVKGFMDAGVMPDSSILDSTGMTATQLFQTGKVAMLMDGTWGMQELATTDVNWGVAPLPNYGTSLTHGASHLHGIAATTKYPEEAWKFVKFLSGYDYQGELCAEGLWLPNRHSMYTEEGLKQWYSEDVYPEGFSQMLGYFENAVVDPAAVQRTFQCTDIFNEEKDMYYKSGQDIDTTLANIDSRIDKAIADAMK